LLADPPAYLPNRLLVGGPGEVRTFDGMIARSPAMGAVFERIRIAAATDTTVLILGESGSGKDLVARSIHKRSPREQGPFVTLHTGAIPHEQIGGELFGQEKGALAGAAEKRPGKLELADGGTLFLDEVSTLDERTQIGLLRVLESARFARVGGHRERMVNVRVLAASNQDLQQLVAAGRFREDLFLRLNVFPIRLPPLRERAEDTPGLADPFLRGLAAHYRH